jgi:RNA polymerase-binding protein DksA
VKADDTGAQAVGNDAPRSDDEARERLLEEQARLQQVRQSLMEETPDSEPERDALSELSLVDQHPADIGTETFEREKDLSILEQVEAQLRDVERAMARLDDGTYGICEACGRPIDAARLEARPATRFCLDDQMAAEGGTPT